MQERWWIFHGLYYSMYSFQLEVYDASCSLTDRGENRGCMRFSLADEWDKWMKTHAAKAKDKRIDCYRGMGRRLSKK